MPSKLYDLYGTPPVAPDAAYVPPGGYGGGGAPMGGPAPQFSGSIEGGGPLRRPNMYMGGAVNVPLTGLQGLFGGDPSVSFGGGMKYDPSGATSYDGLVQLMNRYRF
jgi:hypothetical protein